MPPETNSNPYDVPDSLVGETTTGPVAAVSLPAGNGLNWISDAWSLFKQAPWMMIGLWLVLMIVLTAANMIPFVGQILTPALMAGFMLGLAQLENKGVLRIETLFQGFKTHAGPLLVLGVIFVLTVLLVSVVFGVAIALTLTAMGGDSAVVAILGALVLLILGITFILLVVFAMWWAPCLVVFNELRPAAAMKTAIGAIFHNLLPLLVYSLILVLLYLAVVVTVGLGIFVVAPLVIVSAYTSYKDIFRPV
ncbi:MAG: hypothetical protein CMK83_22575 [Pseudomonadales bacterium]|jgi:hypothetical protein|uniref:BPSS1780 family membrane protein n=1 Tax=unclassified Ketobacter TaxID=2639109 RepID=UPI000C8F96EC|nr:MULTISPECIES: BPSS1780 family membrane protein [unclassified Ketobacter]MAQ27004.1 hypothetical protein [Pseudomonadales bacterium]MEC8810387.1 BPSS1780 family membrane protein [Pseudomonadota bacterium]TNC90104.1 MAG: hypothetical protein CSH49_04145 [Alcanivorax sp.]HAG96098.1 hypothetical protein [Gammaproteobacteria bacterium]MCK5790611.1 hypothetical protein [Ketobacter sp.]|tara:strand:+ start:33410 stop:34159 length:750 start_codon:yes stop_codon:yes gene_type:complete